MTTQAHTPGPWFYEGTENGHVAIDAAGPKRIGLLSKRGFSYPERQANARLIAAAPEMLDALRAIELAVDGLNTKGYPQQKNTQAALNRIKGHARALLAKIEGK